MARRLRIVGMLVSALVAFGGAATAFADRGEGRFGARHDWVPGFSLSYRCTDPRDQLAARQLRYRLHYRPPRWHAGIVLSVDTAPLRKGCDVTFAVPRGSIDDPDEDANVSLQRDGSPAAGTAVVRVRPQSEVELWTLDVILPVHYDVAHSLGIGKHFFRFQFFGAGDAGSFGTGTVEIVMPEGYSLTDASPGGLGISGDSVNARRWTLRAGRDFEAVVTFRQDGLRTAVELAPEIALGAAAVFIALLTFPSRREPEPESEPEPEEELAEAAPSVPLPAPPTPFPPPPLPNAPPALPPPPKRPRRKLPKSAWLGLLAIPVIARMLRRRR